MILYSVVGDPVTTDNFISLLESGEKIVSELKELNSGILTNNLLQAITAYQTYRINKKTKEILEIVKEKIESVK